MAQSGVPSTGRMPDRRGPRSAVSGKLVACYSVNCELQPITQLNSAVSENPPTTGNWTP